MIEAPYSLFHSRHSKMQGFRVKASQSEGNFVTSSSGIHPATAFKIVIRLRPTTTFGCCTRTLFDGRRPCCSCSCGTCRSSSLGRSQPDCLVVRRGQRWHALLGLRVLLLLRLVLPPLGAGVNSLLVAGDGDFRLLRGTYRREERNLPHILTQWLLKLNVLIW